MSQADPSWIARLCDVGSPFTRCLVWEMKFNPLWALTPWWTLGCTTQIPLHDQTTLTTVEGASG